jgi:O-antigen/teichoic acid export membrane protein
MGSTQTKQNPKSGVIKSSISNTAATASSLAVAITLARFYGPRILGAYFFYLVIAQVVTRIPAGIGGSIRKGIRRTDLEKNEYYGAGLFFSFLLVILVLFVGLIGFYELPETNILFGFGKPIFLALLAVIGGQGVFYLLHGPYTAEYDSSWVKTIRHVLIGGVQVWLVYSGYDVFHLLLAYGFVSLFSGILLLFASPNFSVPGFKVVFEILKQSVITIPISAVSNFHHKLDVLVLGVIVGLSSVGRYEAALKLVVPVMVISTTSAGLLSVKLRGSGDGYRASELLKTATSNSTLLAIPALSVFAALSVDTLRYVYGSQFIQVTWLALILLAVTQTIVALRTPMSMALRAVKSSKLILITRTVALLLNIPLSIHFAREYGLIGAIGATFTVEVLTLFFYIVFVKLKLSSGLPLTEILKQLLSSLTAFIVMYSVFYYGYVLNHYVYTGTVILGVITFFVVYISISYRAKYFVRNVFTDF